MEKIQCEMKNPINLGSENKPDFEFSVLECEIIDTNAVILQDPENGYIVEVKKNLNLGDVFMIWFFMFLIGVIIFKALWGFFHTKRVKYHTKTEL